MKKFFSLVVAVLMVAAVTSCKQGAKGGADNDKLNDSISMIMGQGAGSGLKMQTDQSPDIKNQIDFDELFRGIETVVNTDTTKTGRSYLQGILIAMQMIYPQIADAEAKGVNIDRSRFLSEFKKAFNGKDSVDMMQVQQLQEKMQGMILRVIQAKSKENEAAGQKFIADLMKKDKGFKKTASGLVYKVLNPGKGTNFNDSATVDVQYVGRHIDGKEFDSSKGNTVPFNLKQVVPGFQEALTLVNPGAKIRVIIPGKLAYGEQGQPQGGIGPNETLDFEITAVGVHKDEPAMTGGMPGMPGGRPGAPVPHQPAKK